MKYFSPDGESISQETFNEYEDDWEKTYSFEYDKDIVIDGADVNAKVFSEWIGFYSDQFSDEECLQRLYVTTLFMSEIHVKTANFRSWPEALFQSQKLLNRITEIALGNYIY